MRLVLETSAVQVDVRYGYFVRYTRTAPYSPLCGNLKINGEAVMRDEGGDDEIT